MQSLQSALGNLMEDGRGYVIDAPVNWAQGRTLYGGMTAALSLHAAQLRVPELPPLRSAQLTFIGPAWGRLRFTPTLLRQGRASSIVAVDCHAADTLVARSLFTYGAGRESRVAHDFAPAPSVPGPEACEPFFPSAREGPGFAQNFEHRLASGARPLEMADTPEFAVWIRHRNAEGVDPVTALLALADALPPAATVSFPDRGPISTMTWSIDIHHPVPEGDWYLSRSTSEQTQEGYSQQAMDVWDADGRRVAAGRQTVAIFV